MRDTDDHKQRDFPGSEFHCVFSNFSPDKNMLSKDRYVIKNIESIQGTQNSRYPEVNIGNTKAIFTCIKPIEEEKPWHYSYNESDIKTRCRAAIEQETLNKNVT